MSQEGQKEEIGMILEVESTIVWFNVEERKNACDA